MRRCLHSLLVGVLTFALAIDAARACGHLRHHRSRGAACGVPVMAVPTVVVWDSCDVVEVGCPVVVTADCDCGAAAVATFVGGCPTGCEEIACGTPLECCGVVTSPSRPTTGAVETGPTPAAAIPAAPTPTPADTASEAAHRERAPAPLATVPDLEPVAPASALETEVPPEIEPEMPAEEPSREADADVSVTAGPDDHEVPATEPQPAAEPDMEQPEPVAEEPVEQPTITPVPEPAPQPSPEPAPARRNPFEEADAATESPAEPGAVETVNPDGPPGFVDPFDAATVPTPAPAPEEALPAAEPAAVEAAPLDAPQVEPLDEPAVEPLPAAEPADEPAAEPAPAAAAEPLRRWIDATGSFAVVGRLTDVREADVEILKADGRRVTVPLSRLSPFDREYVGAAGPRVAAARGHAPRPIDTASR